MFPKALPLLLISLALPAFADDNPPAPSSPSWTWDSCGIHYSQHLSTKSDAGSDVKDDSITCSRRSDNGRIQTFELGMLADTPPTGSREPVFINGQPQLVSGKPSNQRDTFEGYAGFGEEFDYAPDAFALYNIRVGEINGMATTVVRGFLDAAHRWEGKGYSRHSPLSSTGRPLIQATGLHESVLLGTRDGGAGMGIADVEDLTAGTSLDALTVGLVASVHGEQDSPSLPTGLPGVAVRAAQGNALYAGVFAQETVYAIATEDTGTEPQYLYAKVGGTVVLAKHLSLQVELTHPLTNRIRQQTREGYNYLDATAVYVF